MIRRRGTPDVVESIPVEAQESTCMRRGGESKCRAICLCGSYRVLVTPGGWGGKGSLRVLGSMVETEVAVRTIRI